MPTTLTVSEARASLPAVLDLVTAGDEVTITRHGQPVAVVVRPDALRVRRAGRALAVAAALRDLVVESQSLPLPPEGRLSKERAEELVAEVRSSRATR